MKKFSFAVIVFLSSILAVTLIDVHLYFNR